ncbi:MAG: Gfo/Idh/MocA family oxidoreductase [Candidatus Latescibacterota bacterium]|nr:Gfo/Idh/MocA family oxidoreductase [Candidatus Latescibacterota bacterium]
MATYRTAIIACGMIARVHARGWLGVEGQPTEIAALADTNPDAQREFGDFFGVPKGSRYSDYREMLDKERPDFVDVCSWHQHHAEMVIAAAARQPKAILCQKPMAPSMKEAKEMMMACERNGVQLIIAYQRPHHATWLKAREIIREGVIGKVRQIELYCGGNILNTNSHNIRLGLFLMDEPNVDWIFGTVERTCDLRERGLPAEESCMGLADCDNGASLVIAGNLLPGMGQGCRVFGEEGMMELGTTNHPDEVIPSDEPMYSPEGPTARYNYEIGTVRYLNGSSGGWKKIEARWHDSWAHQCQDTVNWVEGRVETAISSGERGLAVQEVMMGLFESARKRQRIHMPLKTMVNPLQYMIDQGDLPVEWPGVNEVRSRIVRGEAMSWHDQLKQ